MNSLVKSLRLIFLLLSFVLTGNALAAKTLIFGTPPTQSYALTKKNYQPLADYLGEQIGRKIVVEPTKSFHEYTRKMKENHYDIILDGPHFIKYRIEKMNHNVLVKQPGVLKFAIVVKSNSDFETYKDLRNKRICSPATPHLGTLTILDLYPNPIGQPDLKPVQSFKDTIACVKNNKASAAIVRDKYWFKNVKDKKGLRVIYITKNNMPARGLTVNNATVSTSVQKAIVTALTNKKAKKLIKNALSTIGGKKFVKAKESEYTNLNELLSMVWGFHR